MGNNVYDEREDWNEINREVENHVEDEEETVKISLDSFNRLMEAIMEIISSLVVEDDN